jgi:rfaE bifunctional protein kinase chain/domain
MVRLAGTISQLGSCKILVAGDFMLDTYTIGKARRISPEAPVAVVQVTREENRPGGAGNVVLNLVSLGAEVVLVGRIGKDFAGQMLRDALIEEKVDLRGLFVQNGFSTPLKNRIIAENQQIVRVDHEEASPLPEMLEQEIIEALPSLMAGVAAIAISDYGKGFLSRTLLSSIIDQANLCGIPVITDPKGIDFTKYSGTTIIKPNLSEAYAAAGLPPDTNLDLAAQKILEAANAKMLMVTRSEAGISVYHRQGERLDFLVKVREIKDVTGAGDTVLAMLAFATANGLDIKQAAQLSNVAAGIAIERFGCARITLSDLARRLLETDVGNKIFDEEHLFALREALKGRPYNLLGLSGCHGMTSSIFTGIHQLAKQNDRDLVVFLLDSKPDQDFVNLLAAIHDIKFIILQSHNLSILCETIHPNEIYSIVGKEFTKLSLLEDLFNLTAKGE